MGGMERFYTFLAGSGAGFLSRLFLLRVSGVDTGEGGIFLAGSPVLVARFIGRVNTAVETAGNRRGTSGKE